MLCSAEPDAAWRSRTSSLVSKFRAPLGLAFRSGRRSSPFKPDQALEFIGEVRHADLDGGAGDADGTHDEPHPVLLPGEHMLDLGADLRAPGVRLGDPLRQRPPRLSPPRVMA